MAEYKDITPFVRDLTAMKEMYDAISLDGMIKALNDAPAADVAPVVRCKDCKHNHWELEPCHGKTIHYCNAFGFKIDITDALHEFFCGYGERRSE